MNVLFTGKVNLPFADLITTRLGSNYICRFDELPPGDSEDPFLSSVKVWVYGFPALKTMEKLPSLEMIIVPFTGFQQINQECLEEIKRRKIILTNTPWNTINTAQHNVALLLTVLNRTVEYHNRMRGGDWPKFQQDNQNFPLRHRHIGLLGYGRIASEIHRMLMPFGCRFSILNRSGRVPSNPDVLFETCYDSGGLHSFLAEIDTLIISVPQSDETTGLIGAKELELLGKDAVLINTSRGPVVDEKALYQSLKDRMIMMAAIDVWYNYHPTPDEFGRKFPWSPDCPFNELDNIILSPHRGASPIYNDERWEEVINNIMSFNQSNINEITNRIL
ncbi:hypothetical protein KKF34_07320 [Myxococcota bacterium]|nr:hypothetical protein [Myxococcota bacterium]MBU1382825.1 hypothetical protein [Myxococcota bacterium]MBU1496669.1 hypothetical protein [Myxococcota bacterium]